MARRNVGLVRFFVFFLNDGIVRMSGQWMPENTVLWKFVGLSGLHIVISDQACYISELD